MTVVPVGMGDHDEEKGEVEVPAAHGEESLRPNRPTPSRQDTTASTLTLKWSTPNDPANPYNFSHRRKWLITALAVLATFVAMMNGTMITVAHEQTSEYFNYSDANFPNSYWPTTAWTMGGACSVLLVLPIMEDFGSRIPFLGTYTFFLIWLVPQALARNFATMIVARFFAGAAACVLANTSAGVITNIWEDEKARTIPTSVFITAYLAGTSTGPVLGAAILHSGIGGHSGWRWLSWFQLIWCAALMPLYIVFFKETRGAAILARRAARDAKSAQADPDHLARLPSRCLNHTPILTKLKISLSRPLYMLFTEPVLATFVLCLRHPVPNLGPIQAGYIQGAIVIGELLGWPFVFVSSKIYFGSAKRNTEFPGRPIPEARCYVSIVASFLGVVGGMFVYGWCSTPSVPWIAPAIGLAMVGWGINIVVLAIADYVLDSYAKYAGSAIAAAAMGENVFAAFLPLSSYSMYTTLGFQWASSLLGFLALGISVASVWIIIYGRRLRERSPFMESAVLGKGDVGRE
ncbi:putative transporter [Cyphellophora attinorum]|uniref:Putative transporter n=1 Tax=Cyphellophora attinorum TaxID=1664694 RepID=A0A0N1H492_9EURO|nr:putative transporter [Phialophora attinorum]KPI35462.1 putative transporter [Phialophora attinorum]